MRQTACAWRFLPAIIGGGTWEGAPMPSMGRRDFVALLGGAAAAWPIAARAQQAERVRHIGVIMALEENSPTTTASVQQLRDGLHALGWKEGKNLHCTYRFGGGNPER